MAIFDHFPFTNDHELNLDWILKILAKLKGGTKDQVLTRLSNKPLDFGWKTMSGGGGGGGTTDYNDLGNKPSINGVTLEGNKTTAQLNIPAGPELSNTMPLMDGTPQIGSSSKAAKADHVHPSDTSKTSIGDVRAEINREFTLYDPAAEPYDPPYSPGSIGDAIANAGGLPAGGTTGQVLKKTNDGAAWQDESVATDLQVQNAVDEYLTEHPAMTGMFTNAAKNSLITLLNNVTYIDGNGQQYLNELITNLAATVTSISAVFTQGAAVIYDTDSLDILEQYLVVTANYSDGTSSTISTYELTGTLTAGTSSITVSYGGQTDTFTVTVTGTIKLENGTHTFSDGSTLTIQDNHVTVFLNTYTPGRARCVNIYKASENTSDIFSNSNVNNKSTTFATFNAADEVHLDITNANSDNTTWVANTIDYDVAINLRKQNASTSVLPNGITIRPSSATPSSAGGQITEASTVNTITQNVIASCVILYIPGGYPANTTIEFDFRLYVE